jgi:hypothetical protein
MAASCLGVPLPKVHALPCWDVAGLTGFLNHIDEESVT